MLSVIKGDITEVPVQAIVNAANTSLKRGGGVCGAIFTKAGTNLDLYCNNIVLKQRAEGTIRCSTGNAIITPAFELNKFNPSIQYIIHAVGPIYTDGTKNERKLLQSAYKNAINQAMSCNVKSIAFPFISSGIYGYPTEECAEIAMTTLKEFNSQYPDIELIMVAFSDSDYNALINV